MSYYPWICTKVEKGTDLKKSIFRPQKTLQNDYKFFFVIDFGLIACSPLYLNIIIQIIKPSSTLTCKEQRVW